MNRESQRGVYEREERNKERIIYIYIIYVRVFHVVAIVDWIKLDCSGLGLEWTNLIECSKKFEGPQLTHKKNGGGFFVFLFCRVFN